MSIITYRIIDGYGEWISFDRGGNGRLEIRLPAGLTGHIALGGRLYPVSDGVASVNLSDLPDGDYLPRLTTAKQGTALEGIRVHGESVVPLATTEENLRRLLRRVEKIENFGEEIKQALDELQVMIKGNGLFE